jgi:hypothetical protein
MIRARRRSTAVIEALEGRQLFTAILGPSAVEGKYVGDAVYSGVTREVKLTLTSTSETLTVVGIGSETVSESSKQFKKLREGSFSFSGKDDGVTLNFEGSVADSGKRISGDFDTTGKETLSGTFALRKI